MPPPQYNEFISKSDFLLVFLAEEGCFPACHTAVSLQTPTGASALQSRACVLSRSVWGVGVVRTPSVTLCTGDIPCLRRISRQGLLILLSHHPAWPRNLPMIPPMPGPRLGFSLLGAGEPLTLPLPAAQTTSVS